MRSRRGPSIATFLIALVLLIYYVYQGSNKSDTTPTPTPAQSGSSAGSLGQRTKTSSCQSVNALPDSACTPGAIFSEATVEQICQSGYSSSVRNVPEEVKQEAYASYGITSHAPGQYEVDHLVSLELGGSNDISNLWPEPADPRPGFHEK